MNPSRTPIITEHRLARLIAWTRLALAWVAMLMFSAAPKVSTRRLERFANLSLDSLARRVRNLIIIRAVQFLNPRRAPRQRFNFAPAGFASALSRANSCARSAALAFAARCAIAIQRRASPSCSAPCATSTPAHAASPAISRALRRSSLCSRRMTPRTRSPCWRRAPLIPPNQILTCSGLQRRANPSSARAAVRAHRKGGASPLD
jgi:hypothetical protein